MPGAYSLRSLLVMKSKPAIAAKAKEQQIRKPIESVLQKSAEQNSIDTREELAKLADVSHDTINKEIILKNFQNMY